MQKTCSCTSKSTLLSKEQDQTRKIIKEFNSTTQDEKEKRENIIKKVFGEVKGEIWIEPPVYCEYGSNVTFGNGVYFNVCCMIIGDCPVTIGDYVLFGPAVQIGSPLFPPHRSSDSSGDLSCRKSIEIGSDVWVGGGAIICTGVKIGNGSVIAAGSVVTENVPENVLAVGNPCRVIKELIQVEKYTPIVTSVMTEKEKMVSGQMYNPGDAKLLEDEYCARALMKMFNDSTDDKIEKRKDIINQLFGVVGDGTRIEPPFYCDYGSNTSLGSNVFISPRCVILDVCPVTIGDNVILGPAVQIYPATHPILAAERRSGLEFGKPVEIGSDVWIGGGAIICPGVKIGKGSVICVGSVVTKDIPQNVIAAGNPCRIVEEIK